MKRNILFGLAILFAGCAASNIALTDTEKGDYNYGKTKFEGYTKAMFAQGKTIHTKNCQRCHNLKDPAKFGEEKINKVIPAMAKKANLSEQDQDILLKYYLASGKRA